MSGVRIIPSGLMMLEKLVRSCPPTPTNGGMPSKEYLKSLAVSGETIDFDDFMKGFPRIECPNTYNVYDHIREIALKDNKGQIDGDFIVRFFGGEPHIIRAGEDVKEEDFEGIVGKDYAKKALFSHVLTPVEIINSSKGEKERRFTGIYKNGKIQFPIFNLISFPEKEDRIKSGSFVLIHYASIVEAGITDEMKGFLLKVQAENKDFIEACERIAGFEDGINHTHMLHFPWAKKLVTAC